MYLWSLWLNARSAGVPGGYLQIAPASTTCFSRVFRPCSEHWCYKKGIKLWQTTCTSAWSKFGRTLSPVVISSCRRTSSWNHFMPARSRFMHWSRHWLATVHVLRKNEWEILYRNQEIVCIQASWRWKSWGPWSSIFYRGYSIGIFALHDLPGG